MYKLPPKVEQLIQTYEILDNILKYKASLLPQESMWEFKQGQLIPDK